MSTPGGFPEKGFRLGEWLVQPSLHLVTGPSGSIRLEPKVMEVLTYLARRPGQMLTKEEILEAVWRDTFVADGALFRHVSELRRILGDDSRQPRYIETISKKGYRLVALVSYDIAPALEGGAAASGATAPLPATPAEASFLSAARSYAWRKRWLLLPAAALLVTLLGLLVRAQFRGASAGSTRANLAVLHFDNLTGDPSLDWLRLALADMLVTDLAQSPAVDVLSTDRLLQILGDPKRRDEHTASSELVRQVAEKAKADSVLVGSFVKAGERVRINAQLQDVPSGRILMSEKVEGVLDEQLLSMVDELSQRVRSRFETPRVAELDRELKEVTTASTEAYRYYVEGVSLHARLKEDEARVLLEKAVEIDPGFAMALAKLSIVCFNIGQDRRAAEYAERALEHRDRLTLRERYYIEGWHAVRREETLGQAVESFGKAVELYPNYTAARANLGAVYTALERYDDAVLHLEELRRQGVNYFPLYLNLAKCYASLGRFDLGQQMLLAYRQRNPESAAVHRSLGQQLIGWGRLEEGLETMARAAELEPGDLGLESGRLLVAVLREEWGPARTAADRIAASSDSYWRWYGHMGRAYLALYRGRSQDALAELDRAARADTESGQRTALSRAAAARVLSIRGEAARALETARQAQRDAPGDLGEWQGLFAAALAQQALGRSEEAAATAETLRVKTEPIPSEKEKRRFHHLKGELALAQGDAARAVTELEKAQSTLSPRASFAGSELPQHVPIWFTLASAHLAAGDQERAASWLTKVGESTTEHYHWPVPYVRSFYLLGTIQEARGEADAARASYRRFLAFWGEGDLDRAWVELARRKTRAGGLAESTTGMPDRPGAGPRGLPRR